VLTGLKWSICRVLTPPSVWDHRLILIEHDQLGTLVSRVRQKGQVVQQAAPE